MDLQGQTQNTRIRGLGGGGGIECWRHDVSGISYNGESKRGGSPSHIGGSPRETFKKM